MPMYYAMEQPIAARAEQSARAAFIRRTYAHLAGAILALVAIEFAIFSAVSQQDMTAFMVKMFGSPWSYLLVLGAFIGVGWLARSWAFSDASPGLQYAGLGLYVLVQAVVCMPILWIAVHVLKQPNILIQAGVLTLCVF